MKLNEGRTVYIRFGDDWRRGRVVANPGNSITVVMAGDAAVVNIHRSVYWRDVRVTPPPRKG